MVIKRRWLKSKEGGNIDDYFKFDKDKDVRLNTKQVNILDSWNWNIWKCYESN